MSGKLPEAFRKTAPRMEQITLNDNDFEGAQMTSQPHSRPTPSSSAHATQAPVCRLAAGRLGSERCCNALWLTALLTIT